jgi:dienelactone hydrolase
MREARRGWVLGVLALLAPVLHAQQGAKVHLHGDTGYAADGFLWGPAGHGSGGAVLLIHGARGVSAYVRDEAQRLSAAGFVALAIDLSREGQSPTENDAMHDLHAALTFLRAQPNVRADAIGVEGWELGGWYALKLARSGSGIRAVAVTLSQSPDAAGLTDLHCPLLVNLPRTSDRQILALTKKAGSNIKIYPNAHGDFFDPDDPSDFRTQDAEDAGRRIHEFFARELAADAQQLTFH